VEVFAVTREVLGNAEDRAFNTHGESLRLRRNLTRTAWGAPGTRQRSAVAVRGRGQDIYVMIEAGTDRHSRLTGTRDRADSVRYWLGGGETGSRRVGSRKLSPASRWI